MTNDFAELKEVYGVMRNFQKPWFICGGWAIDLALGRKTRDHRDIDIGIFREDQLALRDYLSDWGFYKVVPSSRDIVKWESGDYLEQPFHETRAGKNDQEIEFLLNDSDRDNWIFRRNPNVRLAKKELIQHHDGLPYWVPEISLLFKAKVVRERDEQDFKNIIEFLTPISRKWLQEALETTHPGHLWIKRLA